MQELHKRNHLKGVKTCKLEFCKYCILGKYNKVQFKKDIHKTKGILDHVQMDVLGPTRVASWEGHNYFLTLIDDYSRKV